MEENKCPATSCEMPASVNYRGKWRDDQFNGAGDPEHIPGSHSAIICSIIFALTKSPTQGGSSKVYQLSGARHAPLLYHNFWGWRCVNGQRKYQFHGQPPAEITSQYLSDNAAEKDKVKQAADCCRKILNHVNQAVKESEDKQVWYFFPLFNLLSAPCSPRDVPLPFPCLF